MLRTVGSGRLVALAVALESPVPNSDTIPPALTVAVVKLAPPTRPKGLNCGAETASSTLNVWGLLVAPDEVMVTVPRYEPAINPEGFAVIVIVEGVVEVDDVAASQLAPVDVLALRLKLTVPKPVVVSATC